MTAAEFNLGMLYETGQGVPQNYAEAVKYLAQAAERGYPAAQFNLGVSFTPRPGGAAGLQGGAPDGYLAAAEQQCAPAQCNLGLCYDSGRGVEAQQEAVKWFMKAARQGDKTAQHNLGLHDAASNSNKCGLQVCEDSPH